MNLCPLHDYIVIHRDDAETKTASGIIIAAAAPEQPDQGIVIAVGKGKSLQDGSLQPLSVKVGDRVLFGKYAGQTIKVEGSAVQIMHEGEIMAVVESA